MSEDEYNALAAARKYVWSTVERARGKRWPGGSADRAASVEEAIALAEGDLAKLDAVIDAEDRRRCEAGR